MTINEIMGYSWEDINRMNLKELRQATRVVADVANKRYTRLKERDENAKRGGSTYIAKQAMYAYEQGGGKVTTKGKTYNQLRGELFRGMQFVGYKTSTVKGAIEVYNEREKILYGEKAKTKDEARRRYELSDTVEKLYDKFNELYKQAYQTVGGYSLRGLAAETVTENQSDLTGDSDIDAETLIKKLEIKYEEEYQRQNFKSFNFRNV